MQALLDTYVRPVQTCAAAFLIAGSLMLTGCAASLTGPDFVEIEQTTPELEGNKSTSGNPAGAAHNEWNVEAEDPDNK